MVFMGQYYFLFFLALVWIFFATIQDLKNREVANWLNFSLIGFALAYRAFYAYLNSDLSFFGFGVLGFGVFFALAHVFYYSRTFAGGDAKLLMGLGAILPFESYYDLLFDSIGFLMVLFTIGALYSLVYSVFLAGSNLNAFRKEFRKRFRKGKNMFIVSVVLGFILFILFRSLFGILALLIFLVLPLLYIYLRTLDGCCMIKLVKASELTEGDWLEEDVSVKGKKIRRSVHGLSLKDIKILMKVNKKVMIKRGIPFIPVFLIAWIFMVFFYLVLRLSFLGFFSFLS